MFVEYLSSVQLLLVVILVENCVLDLQTYLSELRLFTSYAWLYLFEILIRYRATLFCKLFDPYS